jgi:hypothetical protein
MADRVNPNAVKDFNNIAAVQKWFQGNARMKGDTLDDLFGALGLDKNSADPEQRHLIWELQVCAYRLGPSRIEKTWYSADFDKRRLKLRERFASQVEPFIADQAPVTGPMKVQPQDALAAASELLASNAPPADSSSSKQLRRTIDLLAHADATDLRHTLRRQAMPDEVAKWPDVPSPGKRADVERLVQHLREATNAQPKAAMKAVVDAVKLVKKSGPSLSVELPPSCSYSFWLNMLWSRTNWSDFKHRPPHWLFQEPRIHWLLHCSPSSST